MFNIIYTPSQTIVSSYSAREDAEVALLAVETSPPSHEIVEVPEVIVY